MSARSTIQTYFEGAKTVQHLSDKPEVIDGCECAICKMHRDQSAAKFDRAWDIIAKTDELAFARKKLSIHEFRFIIRAVSAAFS